MSKLVAIIIFCWCFLQPLTYAENSSSKLTNILHQISKVKTDLSQKKQQQSSVKQQLSSLQKKIIALEADYKKTEKNLIQQRKVLKKLIKDQAYQQNKLNDAQNKLLSQIKLAYQIERPTYFKMVWGESGKVKPDILLTYHKYVFIARFEQMRDIKKVLRVLEQNRKKIKQQTQDLESTEKKQSKQKLDLEKAKGERTKILNSLKNKISLQNKRLKQLLIAKRNLEKLVNQLVSHKFIAMSPELKERLCRNYVWPTKGDVVIRFGSPIEQSSWRWNGVVIKAPLNQGVYAVSEGTVVYADWLSGYGLLLIVDHGSGYMSLYGYNSSLRKKLNSRVAAGEIIATIGSGGDGEPELYFAIRYNGKPIDPERWCH